MSARVPSTLLCLVLGSAMLMPSGCGGDKETRRYKNPSDAINRAIEARETRRRYEVLIEAGLQSIGGFWSRAVPATYNTPYRAPTIEGPYDPEQDAVTW